MPAVIRRYLEERLLTGERRPGCRLSMSDYARTDPGSLRGLMFNLERQTTASEDIALCTLSEKVIYPLR